MTIRNLDKLFQPKSVAIIGASAKQKDIGGMIMHNVLHGGFNGPIMPVSSRYQSVFGVLAYKTITDLPLTPDLSIICSPAKDTPEMMRQLGTRGCKAVLLMGAGLGKNGGEAGKAILADVLMIAKSFGMRVLGPNGIGIMVPRIGLNATVNSTPVKAGKVAFLSKSGALCSALLDWAAPKGIGFSHFISLGESGDVDMGSAIDYLGSNAYTKAILMYIDSIKNGRSFISASRAASRNKPILAIKSGRHMQAAHAAASHTGALAGADDIYEAAFRRAGMLRVFDFEELFAAVETLALAKQPKGDKMAIITNGGGIGVMAVDDLIDLGGKLAEFSPETEEKLATTIGTGWKPKNPLHLGGNASADKYKNAVESFAKAKEVNAVLCMHSPNAHTDPNEIADAVVEIAKNNKRLNLSTCWVGEQSVHDARVKCFEAGIPAFDTPDKAVRSFMHMVNYTKAQNMLMQTPESIHDEFTPATISAKAIIQHALDDGREMLSDPESKAILEAYGIPTIETHIVDTPHMAGEVAKSLPGPYALKILSPNISHKSDVGGVQLNIKSPEDVEVQARNMQTRIRHHCPDAVIRGFTVQRMASHFGAHELIIGVTTDPTFGPVILFGQGGVAVEVIKDRAVALPPLNMVLARELMSRTRVFKLLQGYRGRPAADLEAISQVLIRVAQMVIDLPQIQELDINPLFAFSDHVVAVDARIRASALTTKSHNLAIRPYPKELEEIFHMKKGGTARIRPIRPEDEPNHYDFLSKLTPEDIRFRFFGLVRELPHTQMARLTQIDYDREMAFIAEGSADKNNPNKIETLGVVRTVMDPDNEEAEFSVVVRSDLKGTGLAKALMLKMINYCKSRNTKVMIGEVLVDNRRMLTFTEHLGFRRFGPVEDDIVQIRLDLTTYGNKSE
jgi:acetyltransferase